MNLRSHVRKAHLCKQGIQRLLHHQKLKLKAGPMSSLNAATMTEIQRVFVNWLQNLPALTGKEDDEDTE